MLDQQFTLDKTNAVYISVKPKKGVTTADAQEAATVRALAGAAPFATRQEKNNFDLLSQDQILDMFIKITDVFFLVMIVLSVALDGRRHRRDGDHDGVGLDSHTRDRYSQGDGCDAP